MLRKGILLCLWSLYLCAVDTQEVSCTDDDQCSKGYYCVKEIRKCSMCLSCEDLQREAPLTSNPCITSVAECGACFKGLVVDHLGDVNSACVVSGSEVSGATPPYVWWLVSAVIIFLALTIFIIILVYLNPGIFENLKFGVGNCQSGVNITTEARPSAPEAPPPYAPPQYNDIPYSSVRTTESPCPPHQEPENGGRVYFEEEGPFIKRSSTAQPGRARQSAGTEAANVFNLPFYERQDLPSSDTPTVTELNDNLAIHDEETMESMWSPSGPTNGDVNSNASEVVASSAGSAGSAGAAGAAGAGAGAAGDSLPAMLAAARDTSLVEHTPPKQLCIRPPSTNRNRCSNPGGDGNQGNFSGSQNGAPYFVTQITNVVQFSRTN